MLGGNGADDGKLLERSIRWGSNSWHQLPSPPNKILRTGQIPSILQDGQLFVTTFGGEVMQMWRNNNNNTWNWHNHGHPKKFKPIIGGVKALTIGAPMPRKVFARGSDGSLRQLYYNGSEWIWHNHHWPDEWKVDSTPVSISDGKLFVIGNSNGTRVLLELYWNGSTWVWNNHGMPGVSISGGVTAAYNSDRVVVKDNGGNIWMRFWNGSDWVWKNCEYPGKIPQFTVKIRGLVFGNNRGTYTWESLVSNGKQPYTYKWEYTQNGSNYFPFGSDKTITDHLPLDQDLHLRLTVFDSDPNGPKKVVNTWTTSNRDK